MTRLEKVIDAVYEQRRINMQKVINNSYDGSPSACERVIERRRGFAAQLVQRGSPIPFGERLARDLEIRLRIPLFSLDR